MSGVSSSPALATCETSQVLLAGHVARCFIYFNFYFFLFFYFFFIFFFFEVLPFSPKY